MKTIYTKAITALLTMTLLCIVTAIGVFAQPTGPDIGLDFTSAYEDVSGEGYSWNHQDKILTITGLNHEGEAGIILPDDATIVLNGDLTLDTLFDCIYAEGDLVIKGTGNISLTTKMGSGIYVKHILTTDITGNVDISSGESGIYIDNDENSTDAAVVKIVGDAIWKTTHSSVLYAEMPVFLQGAGSLLLDGYVSVAVQEMLSIDEKAVNAIGSCVVDNPTSEELVALTNGATMQGIFKIDTENNGIPSTTVMVQGDCVMPDVWWRIDSLVLAENSTLTVPKNIRLNLKECTSFDNASGSAIINNGIVRVNENAVMADFDLYEGTGVIRCYTQESDYTDYLSYDNDGNLLLSGILYLDDQEVTDNDLYSWTKEGDVYTFKSANPITDVELNICVEKAVMDSKNGLTLSDIYLDNPAALSDDLTDVELTFTGNGTLVTELRVNYDINAEILIDQGVTVESSTRANLVQQESEQTVTMTINGRYQGSSLELTQLIIGDTGSILLDGSGDSYAVPDSLRGGSSSGMPVLMLWARDSVTEPLQLSDKVKVFDPVNGGLVAVSFSGMAPHYIFTTDGKDLANDESNMATTLEIGKIPTYDITVSQTGEGVIYPGTSTVTEGENLTFAITSAANYEIQDILVDGVSVGVMSNYTFENVTEAHTLEVIFEQTNLTFDTTNGNGQVIAQADKGVASFKIDADFGRFANKITINGTEVAPSNYTIDADTQTVTLKAAYLQKFAAGKYTMIVAFDNGTATTDFTIVAPVDDEDANADTDGDSQEVPGTATGDSAPLTIYVVLFVLAASALTTVVIRKNSNKLD